MPQPAIHTAQLPHTKPGVFFAPVAGEGVLLDLAANRYVGLTALSSRLWSVINRKGAYEDLIEIATHDATASKMPAERVVQQQLDLWKKAGLLVREGEVSGDELPVPHLELPRAADTILPGELAGTRLSLFQVARQILNSIWVRRSLRQAGLSTTIRSIQQIPVQDSKARSSTLKAILRAYWMARKPFAQGNPDCLSRSLALFRTLRQAGTDASICIGVRKCPFAAHAWVEAASLLLNDTPENTGQYFVIARF